MTVQQWTFLRLWNAFTQGTDHEALPYSSTFYVCVSIHCKNIYKLAIAMPLTVTHRINARSEKNYVTNSKIRKIAQNVSTPTEPTQVRTSRWLISVTVGQWHKSGAKQLVKKVRVSKCVCVWNWVCMHARACVRGSVGVRANVRKSWSETKQG